VKRGRVNRGKKTVTMASGIAIAKNSFRVGMLTGIVGFRDELISLSAPVINVAFISSGMGFGDVLLVKFAPLRYPKSVPPSAVVVG
jgi:hypothetical protein